MFVQIQNFFEVSFVTCIILFIDPTEMVGIGKLLLGAFIVFLGRVSCDVFLSKPISIFLRKAKKKLFRRINNETKK